MRFSHIPRPLLRLVTAILLFSPRLTIANPNPHPSEQAGFTFNELFARYDCSGQTCGWQGQLCCTAGSACATNAQDQAVCTPNAGAVATSAAAAAAAAAAAGSWQYYTTTYVETDRTTITSVMSSYVAGAAATATAACSYALNETPCGSICCASDQYCFSLGQCVAAAAGGSSGYYSSYTAGASAPLRPTTAGTTVVVATVSPTMTVPFVAPVPTGANVTITGSEMESSSGLSGGAIAGIVIGVLVGLALLGLLCFYCCLKGLLDGLLACFGLRGKKQRTTEIEEYERYSHHSGRAGGRGRTWYGAAKPATRVDRKEKKSHEGRNFLGVGAGLAALWAILGLKRRREDRRREEKYSDYSSDSYVSPQVAQVPTTEERETPGTRGDDDCLLYF